jgi:MFS family permease
MVISSEFIARTGSLIYWGRQIDRAGSLKVLGIVSRFIPVIPLLWLFSINVIYLVVIQLISGVMWAAFDLCNQTFINQAAPSDLRLRYIVYNRSLSSFTIAAGALTGAFLLNYVFPVFGNQILGLFLVSGIVRFIIVISIFPGLSKKVNEVNTLEEEKPVIIKKPAMVTVYPRDGLHYQPVHRVTPRKGMFYHPEKWAYYYQRPSASRKPVKIIPARSGMFYRPGDWEGYIKEAAPDIPTYAVYHYDIKRLGLDKPLLPVSRPRLPVTASF